MFSVKKTTTIFLTDYGFQLTVVTQCKQVLYVSEILSCGSSRRACE